MSDFPGTECYRERVASIQSWLEGKRCFGLEIALRTLVEEQNEEVEALCDHIEEQDTEIERLRGVLVHADANLSLIRHRGIVEWGKGIPETWEIDRCIGKIRRASEGKP